MGKDKDRTIGTTALRDDGDAIRRSKERGHEGGGFGDERGGRDERGHVRLLLRIRRMQGAL